MNGCVSYLTQPYPIRQDILSCFRYQTKGANVGGNLVNMIAERLLVVISDVGSRSTCGKLEGFAMGLEQKG